VFVLDTLTGVLRGARLNNQTGTFTQHWVHNVAADFQVTFKNPEFDISVGTAQLTAAGSQPARGVIYIGEKTTGVVAAYGFRVPRGNGNVAPLELIRLSNFRFRPQV